MKEKKYFKLTPFKMQVLQSFPFIDEDFDALTNYELLCKVVDYLNKTVSNVDLLNDELEEFKKYFDNLDVQEEIDNKLDEMAESGELEEIMADYLNTKTIFGFDTKADMIASTNLIDGSYAKTLGNTDYTDGDGSIYKIRKITNSDVVDNDIITPLTNSETLIAEKIPYSNTAYIQSQVTTNSTRLSLLDNKKVIIIGDSYANRTNSWQDRIKSYAGLSNENCVLNRKSSTGFIATIDNTNFITMLTDNVTIPANEVTDIIVCGGINDRFHTITELESAIQTFINTARNTYPNAEIYFGFISWISPSFDNYSNTIGTLNNICNAWKRVSTYNIHAHYLNNVEYTLHNIANIDDSHAHPTDNGQLLLAQNIMTAWVTGSCDVEQSSVFGITVNTTGNITAVSGQFLGFISNGISYLKASEPIGVTFDSTAFSLGSTKIDLGTLKGGFLMGKSYATATTVGCLINLYTSGYIKIPCTLYVNDGHLYLKIQATNSAGWINERVTQFTINEFEIIGSSMQQY